ncbi:MAG: hypothetical protein R3C28_28690 [Pirellulaceae bacterium]
MMKKLCRFVLAFIVIYVVGCSRTPDSTGPKLQAARLSAPAVEIAELLDDGKSAAARTLIDIYLQRFPADGGLHAQHARLLMEEYDLLYDVLQQANNSEIVVTAVRNAVQFSPELKPYVADLLLRKCHASISEAVARKEPIELTDLNLFQLEYVESLDDSNVVEKVTASILTFSSITLLGATFCGGGWDNLLFEAKQLDAQVAKDWSPSFRALSGEYLEQNWTGSALYLKSACVFLENDLQDEELELLRVAECREMYSGKQWDQVSESRQQLAIRVLEAFCKVGNRRKLFTTSIRDQLASSDQSQQSR